MMDESVPIRVSRYKGQEKRYGWLLARRKRSQHSAIFGHTSPQFNLQVSSYPATATQDQDQDLGLRLPFFARRDQLAAGAFCTYEVVFRHTIPQSTTSAYHSV
jgi:hypothetical protein